jgi:hypothetical protein
MELQVSAPLIELCHTGEGDCVAIGENSFKIVIPAKAGIQNLLKLLDSVSRFACTE